MKRKKHFTTFIGLFIICVACSFQNKADEREQELIVTKKNDTITEFIIFRIINTLPIGWGTNYKCRIESCSEGLNYISEDEFILSIAVGSEEKFKPVDIHSLSSDIHYRAEFVKAQRNEEPYVPAGTTGFQDSEGYIWLMKSISVHSD